MFERYSKYLDWIRLNASQTTTDRGAIELNTTKYTSIDMNIPKYMICVLEDMSDNIICATCGEQVLKTDLESHVKKHGGFS